TTAARPASAAEAVPSAHARSARASGSDAASSVAAPTAISWSTPIDGTSQNAVANVPAIEPAVETENNRPAVRPTESSRRDAMRTAIGVTVASTTLAGPNSTTAAKSGSARGPG